MIEKIEIEQQLQRILQSSMFNNSRRYGPLLRYVVDAAVNGDASQIKERTIGVEVFGRPADYDTNADPIVRVTAGEVRKRIALYYHENEQRDSELRIGLHPGSYIPDFFPAAQRPLKSKVQEKAILEGKLFATTEQAEVSFEEHKSRQAAKSTTIFGGLQIALIATGVALGATAMTFALHRNFWKSPTIVDQFWSQVISAGNLTIIVPDVLANRTVQSLYGLKKLTSPKLDQLPVTLQAKRDEDNSVNFKDARVVAMMAKFVGLHNMNHHLISATHANLRTLQDSPTVLLGGLDNQWAILFTEKLRYHFQQDPVQPQKYWIADARNPSNHDWNIDFNSPAAASSHDYAIVARIENSETRKPLIIAAGLGPSGTVGAGEFLTSPAYLQELLMRMSPSELQKSNIEVVLEIDVLGPFSGPPHIIASTTW